MFGGTVDRVWNDRGSVFVGIGEFGGEESFELIYLIVGETFIQAFTLDVSPPVDFVQTIRREERIGRLMPEVH